MLKPGARLGTYEIESRIGEGALGVVYRARDTRSDETLAIKTLAPELAESGDYRERLAREGSVTAQIDSPYVVRVLDHGESDGTAFVAMELISGKELRDCATELTYAQKIDVTLKLADGIAAAHGCGLVHRDLKPENIIITDEGDPKILDFGVAREVDTDSVDEFGDVAGTLYYLSPEQVSGDVLSARSDLFSFGSIIYELFVGQRPFEGAYSAAIIYSILHEDAIPPCDVNADLPVWFNSLIDKLLAKRPEDRFADAASVKAFVESCSAGDTAPAEGPRTTRRTATVIDLKNLSGDESWNYFCEGFTDEVIKELSRRTNLVVSAEPATSFKRNIPELFDKLRTDFIVVGSLMKLGEKIQLALNIYGDDGDKLIWDDKFVEPADNLFDLLSKAAAEASAELAKVTNSFTIAVEDLLKTDVSAYDYYLKGKNYYQTNKPHDLEFAADMYRRALEADPRFAAAHAGLADVYAFQYMAYYDRTPERIDASRSEALKALELNPQLPEAHRSLARYYMFTGDLKKSEECLLRTIDLDPKYAIGYRTLGWLKRAEGDFQRADEFTRTALQLAPTDLETLLLLSLISMNVNKLTLAMATLQRAVELGPDYGRAYYALGQVYLLLGVLPSALENFVLAIKYEGDPNAHIDCGFVLIIMEQYEQARVKFQQSREAGFFDFVAAYFTGLTYTLEGDRAQAETHYHKALDEMRSIDTTKQQNRHVVAYRALALAALGETEKARKRIETLDVADEVDGEVLYNVARCHAMLGDRDGAQNLLKRATSGISAPTVKLIRLDPHFRGVDLNFADLGETKKAPATTPYQ
jgi:serine/threonine protein kinase/tetratricopeptide (TPR) repeat protein